MLHNTKSVMEKRLRVILKAVLGISAFTGLHRTKPRANCTVGNGRLRSQRQHLLISQFARHSSLILFNICRSGGERRECSEFKACKKTGRSLQQYLWRFFILGDSVLQIPITVPFPSVEVKDLCHFQLSASRPLKLGWLGGLDTRVPFHISTWANIHTPPAKHQFQFDLQQVHPKVLGIEPPVAKEGILILKWMRQIMQSKNRAVQLSVSSFVLAGQLFHHF